MGMELEEEIVVSDNGKKSKHMKKKSKTDDLEENSLNLSKEVEEEKKRKKKHVVSGDIKTDSAAVYEDGNGKGCEEVDGDVQEENDQKKKKKRKKRKLERGEDVSDCKDEATIAEKNVMELSDNEKKKEDVYGDVQNEKNKIHKKKKRKIVHKEDAPNDESQIEGENGQKSFEKEDIVNIKNGEEGSKEKKSKKEKKMKAQGGEESGKIREESVKDDDGAVEKKRKKKRKIDHDEDTLNVDEAQHEGDNIKNDGKEGSKEKKQKSKKKKSQEEENAEDNDGVGENKRKKEKKKDDKDSENPKRKQKKPKKVRFSGNVEVFPIEEEKLVRGKRFSKEEDEKVKEAVYNYIATHNLGEEGLNKILNCRSHPEIRNCWKEIGTAIPYRPFSAIYYRAHILFERSEHRKWTEEEIEFVKKTQEKHGNNWKLIADELGKHRFHVKDTWRRIKLPNMKKGHWSQDEYQTLFDLVNMDLQMKASEEKKLKHGMLRDNICWGAISDKLSTRTNQMCCEKWYSQLSSPMVQEGTWADVDDYRLLDALFHLDECCVEDVDWDGLIEDRSGEVCRKRWDQMVRHIGHHGLKSFSEQVDILAKRYCPHLVEVREEWGSKPAVD